MELLEEQLRQEEGEKLHAYKDHLGFLTIGIGRLIDQRRGGGITREESRYLFHNDLLRKEKELHRAFPWVRKLDEARYAVIIGMAFQMGIDGLKGFVTTMGHVEAGRYDKAAEGMLHSLWARQTPGRAERMARQMRTGEWQFKDYDPRKENV